MHLIRILSLFALLAAGSSVLAAPPILITEADSTRAIALASPFFTREPFRVSSPLLLNGDNKTQIMFFVLFPEPPSWADNLTVYARDAGGATYYFEVQHFAKAPGQEFYQVTTRLFNEPPETAGDLLVRVHQRGIWSNAARIGFGHVGGGLPDGSLPHPLSGPCPPTQIVFDGDSMTEGRASSQWNEAFADATTYPWQVMRLIGCGYRFHNFGIAGQTVEQMSADAAAQVDSLWQSGSKNLVVAWGGTNALALGTDVATTYSHLIQYCQARRARGFKVIVLTMLPRSDQWVAVPDIEQKRLPYNSLIRANWPSFADSLVDVAADSDLGNAGDELGPFYAADRVHLNDGGNLRVAGAVKAAIIGLQ